MRIIKNFLLMLFCIWYISCTKDFIAKDIRKETVAILAPANNLITPDNSVTFWWEKLDGADKYNLQIVKPNFNAVQQLITDTNITNDKFICTLKPGTYQWRIKGINNGGSSMYNVYNLVIDTTSNLSSQLIIPVSPINSFLTGSKTINFSWNGLASASNYQVQILNSLNAIVKDTTTVNTGFTTSLLNGGGYSWKVRAYNAYSISQFNYPFTFTVDVTSPPVSVINYPLNGSSVKDTTELKWIRSSADTNYDSLYISIDSAFTSLINVSRVYSTKIKINTLSPAVPVSSNYYWWRVKSVDSVGNKSGYSNQLKFKLIP